MIDLLDIKKNHLYTGRAATAIYLVLQTEGICGKKVLYPANICYAAVYPAVYADCVPVFCDIDSQSGNINLDEFKKMIGDISVAVIPHMYGNPIPYIEEIATECRQNGVIMIEDCASAMGAQVGGRLCGEYGDYSIFSTGYSKTIDIGRGGILFSDKPLDKAEDIYFKLPTLSNQAKANISFFSKLYRLVRNNQDQSLDVYIWRNISHAMKDSFLYKEEGISDQIESALSNLPNVIKKRRENTNLYTGFLDDIKEVEVYKWEQGSVPWRYNILVDKDERSSLIEYLLDRKLPISDWYPDITNIFTEKAECKKALEMGDRILNFPLLTDRDIIQSICRSIAEFYG